VPLVIEQKGKQVKLVASGAIHNCTVDISSYIICWGSNKEGQTDVPEELTGKAILHISLGAKSTCVIKMFNGT